MNISLKKGGIWYGNNLFKSNRSLYKKFFYLYIPIFIGSFKNTCCKKPSVYMKATTFPPIIRKTRPFHFWALFSFALLLSAVAILLFNYREIVFAEEDPQSTPSTSVNEDCFKGFNDLSEEDSKFRFKASCKDVDLNIDRRDSDDAGFLITKGDTYSFGINLKDFTGGNVSKGENKISFEHKFKEIPVELVYTVSENQIKEELLIKDKPTEVDIESLGKDHEIPFELKTENLVSVKDGESLIFVNQDTGVSELSIPPLTLTDNDGNSGSISYEYDEDSHTYYIRFATDFLKTAVYPVVIDPTVIINTSSTTTATYPSHMRRVIVTSDGTIHSFLQTGTETASCGGPSLSGLLWFNSTDAGSTWVCQGQLSSDTTNLFYASVVADSSDNLYVTYSQVATGVGATLDINYRKITYNGGSSWTLEAEQLVLDGSGSAGYTFSAIENEGTTRLWLTARYFDGTNYQTDVYYSNGLGTSPSWTQSISSIGVAGTSATYNFGAPVRFGTKIGTLYRRNNGALCLRHRADTDSLSTWSVGVDSFGNDVDCKTGIGTTFSYEGTEEGYIQVLHGGDTFMVFNGIQWQSMYSDLQDTTETMNVATSAVATDGTNAWGVFLDTTGFISTLPGNAQISYKKGVPMFDWGDPVPAGSFDINPTRVVSHHGIFDKYWRFNGASTYTDDTIDAGDNGLSDVTMPTTAGMIAYFGKSETFDSISWEMYTNATGGAVTWEYWNGTGSTWDALTFTASSNTTFEGDGWAAFTAPANWATTAVNGATYYYIRARVTTSLTGGPSGSQMASMPQINNVAISQRPVAGKIYVVWTENTSSPMRIRSASFSVTPQSTTPATVSNISPALVAATQADYETTEGQDGRKIVKTSNGNLHLFINTEDNNFGVYPVSHLCDGVYYTGLLWFLSTDSGSTWTCKGRLSIFQNFSYQRSASVAADSGDNLYVVYSNTNLTTGSTYKDLFYRKFTYNGGTSWTMGSEQVIFDATTTADEYTGASIAVEGTTRLWLVVRHWNDTDTNHLEAYYSDGLSASPVWTTSIDPLNTPGTYTSATALMTRYGGNKTAIIYEELGSTYKMRYRSDTDPLTSWSSPITIVADTSPYYSELPRASIAGTDSGYIFFLIPGWNFETFFTSYNGSTWDTPFEISPAPTNYATISNDSMANANLSTDGSSVWVFDRDLTGISDELMAGNFSYKKGVAPYGSANFDASWTPIVSRYGTFDKVWSYYSGVYSDETADAANATLADVQIVSTVGDIIYFGESSKFDTVTQNIDMPIADDVGRVVWEYYNGSAWVPIVNFADVWSPSYNKDDDYMFITFPPPDDWATTSVNGEGSAYYYVRAKVITAFGTTPVGSQMVNYLKGHHPAVPERFTDGTIDFVWVESQLLDEGYGRVRYSGISVSSNSNPSTPTSLGPSSVTGGGHIGTTQPQYTFTLSDSDSSDTVKFRIQIDNNSDFSSPAVDYTSALGSQGSYTFTVGQSAGSGSYTTGSSGQTLSEDTYYWRVKTIDNSSAESSYATANSGSVAFILDTTSPAAFELISPANGSYTSSERPSFKWKTTSDTGSGLESFTLEVDNGDTGDFSIAGIPTSGTSDIVTNKYVIHFYGFNDGDSTNNYISLYTKSSSEWKNVSTTNNENDGKLKEGRRTWTVKARDNVGNTTSSSWDLLVDYHGPDSILSTIDGQSLTSLISTSDTTSTTNQSTTSLDSTQIAPTTVIVEGEQPTFNGRSLDVRAGDTTTRYVASGPQEIELLLEIPIRGNPGQVQGISTAIAANPQSTNNPGADKRPQGQSGEQPALINQLDSAFTNFGQVLSSTLQTILETAKSAGTTLGNALNQIAASITDTANSLFSEPVKSTPTPKPKATPKGKPQASPSPSLVPTPLATPRVTPQPAPTPLPTVSPLASPLPSPSPSPIVFPSPSPVASPSPGPIVGYTLFKRVTIPYSQTYFSNTNALITDNSVNTANKYGLFGYFADTPLPQGEYRLTLRSKDKVGNLGIPQVLGFEVKPESEITRIFDVEIAELGTDYAVITWRTNHDATSIVDFGLTTSLGGNITDSTLTRFHRMTLTNLTPDTLYYFLLSSQGKTYATEILRNFRTLALLSSPLPSPDLFVTPPSSQLSPEELIEDLRQVLLSGATTRIAGELVQIVATIAVGTTAAVTLVNIYGSGMGNAVTTFHLLTTPPLVASVPILTKIYLTGINYFHGIAIYFYSLLVGMGFIKKKRKSLGVVFDSTSPATLPQTFVVFYSESGNLKSAVTNAEGRFQIQAPPDRYYVRTEKKNYVFPSQIIKVPFNNDYARIYLYNEKLSLTEAPQSNIAIPLDPLPQRISPLKALRTKLDHTLHYVLFTLYYPLIIVGVLVVAYATFIYPTTVNKLMLLFTFISAFVALRSAFVKDRDYGVVKTLTGKPLSNLTLKLYLKRTDRIDLYAQTTTDLKGRYLFTPENGSYRLEICNQNGQLLKTEIIEVSDKFPKINKILRI